MTRPIICTLLLTTLASAACSRMKTVTLDQMSHLGPERVWVTESDESVVLLYEPKVVRDTLVGYVGKHREKLPSAGVKQVRVQTTAPARTAAVGGRPHRRLRRNAGRCFGERHKSDTNNNPGRRAWRLRQASRARGMQRDPTVKIICALLLATLASAACSRMKSVTLDQMTLMAPERVWLTEHDQSVTLMYEPKIVRDTLVGYVGRHREKMPSARVKDVRVQSNAPARTALLIGGITVGLAAFLVAVWV